MLLLICESINLCMSGFFLEIVPSDLLSAIVFLNFYLQRKLNSYEAAISTVEVGNVNLKTVDPSYVISLCQ